MTNGTRTLGAAWLLATTLLLASCGGEDDPADPIPDGDPTTDATLDADLPAPDLGTRCLRDDQCPEDRFCAPAETAGAARFCALGCREAGCEIGRMCDPTLRICVRDPSCAADATCDPGEYCDGTTCQPGCRLDDPEACPRTALGEPRACEPTTRECTIQVVCCDPADACTLALPTACADPIPGLRNCVNPNPCALRCETDPDCADEMYCGDGACVEGCRAAPDNCGRDRLCDPETRACTRPTCAADTDCAATQYCDFDVCLPGCRLTPDNCPAQQLCDPQHRCVPEDAEPQPCRDDAECAAATPGWICEAGTCEPPCLAHDECPDPLACVDGRCADGCRDDALEPNNARETARPLNFQGRIYTSDELIACARDRDWYRFDTPTAGTSIRVTLRFTDADGDLDARLHAPDGRIAGRGESSTDNELIEYTAGPGNPSPAGTWWVEVYARGLDENRYTLEIELIGGIGPDAAEPDDAPVTATRLSLPEVQQTVTIEARTIHPGDVDWFSFDMGARAGLRIRLEMLGNPNGQSDELTFELSGPGAPAQGTPPAALPNGGDAPPDGPRYIQFDAPRFNAQIQDGRYYLRVTGLDRNQFGAYRLTLTVDRDGVLCLPDPAEPNDQPATAYDLMTRPDFVRPGFDGTTELRPAIDLTLRDLTLCDESDYYTLTLRPGDALEVRVERLEQAIAGDTIIEIRDTNGAVLSSGRSGQRINLARLVGAAGGRYQIRVQSAATVRTGYTLALVRTAGPIRCDADRFDAAAPNNTRATATRIQPGTHPDLTLCGAAGDEDWYTFTTATLATLDATIRFAHIQGDLELDLYYEDAPAALNAELPAGHSATDDETVRFDNRAPGTYTLRVRGLGDPTARYTLELTVTDRIFICQDDPTEPSETFDEAVVLGQAEVDRQNQWLCVRAPADRDTYLVTVPANQSRAIAASFIFGDDGDLSLDVFDIDEMLRATTSIIERGNSKQCVVIEAAPINRVFFVQVLPLSINTVGQDDERLDYRLRIRAGGDCDAIPPDAPGVIWPRVID